MSLRKKPAHVTYAQSVESACDKLSDQVPGMNRLISLLQSTTLLKAENCHETYDERTFHIATNPYKIHTKYVDLALKH
ncbi:Hypothetical predicted protein [Octopus vulgaris]|uniref:Uncharacterized protein n=1 Tax=Octopus vulgaris TaxID=6645 RepID=A0AA36FAL8_OCTVU|nr:Hypothetical predicted protein [Octopus vulgaris]